MAQSKGEQLQELRRSNASGIHSDRRLKRLKTRNARKVRAIQDQDGR